MKRLSALVALSATLATAADIREGLYEISVRAELAGQPMTQAPMIMRQCVSAQSVQELMGQMGGAGGCKISDLQQSGNQAHWNIACSGQVQVNGTGETHINGDEFTGRMNLSVQVAADQSVPMVQNFTAKRVGECQ